MLEQHYLRYVEFIIDIDADVLFGPFMGPIALPLMLFLISKKGEVKLFSQLLKMTHPIFDPEGGIELLIERITLDQEPPTSVDEVV